MAVAAQSDDGKAAYVQLNLPGNPGETLADESVAAVRQIVAQTPPPPGIQVYVTGPATVVSDVLDSGARTILIITLASLTVIFTMLLIVYRSIFTTILLLLTVGVELQLARGIVAFLAEKRRVDPSEKLVNGWYLHHRSLLSRGSCETRWNQA